MLLHSVQQNSLSIKISTSCARAVEKDAEAVNCPSSAYKGTTEGQFAAKKPLITMKFAVFTADFYFFAVFFL